MAALTIVDYQAHWPQQFLVVAEQVRCALPVPDAVIEHIGSTAVPGLCAKPVLDLLLGVASLTQVEASVAALASQGFVYRPEYEALIPDRRYFTRPPSALPRVHLHGVLRGGALWLRHLYVRDRLRANASLRDDYAALKRQLAEQHAGDKAAYQDAKAPFLARLLDEERATAAHTEAAPTR
jgi:GrpB-like predicted nucleotidyltransferase (UPF0157 family)